MNPKAFQSPEQDRTLRMLGTLVDGTIAGLATYHLWRMQLVEIRTLPESGDVPPG